MTAGEDKGGTSQGFEALVEGCIFARPANRRKQQRWRLSGGGSRAASPWAGPRWIRRCGAVVPVQLHRVLIGLAFTGQRRQIGPGSRAMLGVGEIGEIDGSLTLFVCFPPPHSIIMPCGFWGGMLAASPESVPGPSFLFDLLPPMGDGGFEREADRTHSGSAAFPWKLLAAGWDCESKRRRVAARDGPPLSSVHACQVRGATGSPQCSREEKEAIDMSRPP
jgi:hypothetical protein